MAKEHISRDEMIEQTKARIVLGAPKFNAGLEAAIEVATTIPASDVAEVRHGRWKLHEDGSGTCQECGCRQKYVWDMDGWQNYCGHCGADMRNGGGRTILQSL